MFALIGYFIAFGCVFGVYVMHGGNVSVLAKALPFEMATIGGAAFGAFLVSIFTNPCTIWSLRPGSVTSNSI